MTDFTHFNKQGRAKMVDITEKETTVRTAVAATKVTVNELIYKKVTNNEMAKGDVLAVAQVAGVMAAKNTSQWIPMCHPLQLSGVDIQFDWKNTNSKYELIILVTVKTKGSTGDEMEALTADSATDLKIYEMCKAIDKGIIIGNTYLLSKTGGKSGDYQHSSNG